MTTAHEAKNIEAALQSTRGRKANTLQVAPEPNIDTEKIGSATLAMREQGMAQREQEDAQLAMAAQAVGGALMARLHKNFSHAAEVNMFNQVRDLPLAVLRRIPLPEIAATAASFDDTAEGASPKTAATAANLEDFCRRVFGRSATVLREEAQNLQLLGEQAYEVSAQLRIGRNALRLTRALPPEKLEVVRTAISNGSTKAEVLAVIEDLAERVQQAEAAVQEEKAEHQASKDLAATKQARIEKLEREALRIAKIAPDEDLKKLQHEATTHLLAAQGAIRGQLRAALVALQNHAEDNGAFMAGMVAQLMADLTVLRDEFNLQGITGDGVPDWQKWAAHQSAAPSEQAPA